MVPNVSCMLSDVKVDGILCLADILTDETSVEAARAEAAAVVAQITSPHHTSTQHLASFLESMHDIVTALISEWTWSWACKPDLWLIVGPNQALFGDTGLVHLILMIGKTKITGFLLFNV